MSVVGRLHLSRNAPWLFDLYWQCRFLLAIAYERFLMSRASAADHSHTSGEWDFTANAEQERYRQVRVAISRHCGTNKPARVLELGCAQGLFTNTLASLADEVVGLDIAPTACAAAQQRCAAHPTVTIYQGDVFTADLRGPYSLILAMGVLQYVHGAGQHAQLAGKLHQALAPDGLLLINEVRLPARYENCWWARKLVTGGVQYVRFLAQYPGLHCVYHAEFPDYVIAVYQKEMP